MEEKFKEFDHDKSRGRRPVCGCMPGPLVTPLSLEERLETLTRLKLLKGVSAASALHHPNTVPVLINNACWESDMKNNA